MAGDAFLARVKSYCEWIEYAERSQQDWKWRIQRWWGKWHAVNSRSYYPNGWAVDGSHTADSSGNKNYGKKSWQHVLSYPYGFINEEAQTTALSNLVAEAAPPFRARGWQLEDVPTETPRESLTNYEFSVLNPVTEWVREAFTRGYVQGIAPLKCRYVNQGYNVNILPKQWDISRFQQALSQALEMLQSEKLAGDKEALAPPGMVAGPDGQMRIHPTAFSPKYQEETMRRFAQWTAAVRQKYGVEVPMPPVGKTERVYRHVGIKVMHIELPDILWDPRTPTMREQKRVAQRMVADKDELLLSCKEENARAKNENRPEPFDLAAIQSLQPGLVAHGHSYSGVGDFQSDIMRWLGIQTEEINEPALENAVEVYEVWEPGDSLGRAYWCWIGQRDKPLTREGHYPLSIPVHPYAAYVNIPTPGQLIGKSDYDIFSASHDHLDTMLGYEADYAALTVGQPIYRKGGSLGEIGRKMEIAPFDVHEAEDDETYGALFDFSGQRQTIAEHLRMLERRIDIGSGIDDVSRGQSAQVNRVGVGEVQIRASNQQNRPRDKMYRLGTMCGRDLIPLGMAQVMQFATPEHIRNVSGGMPFSAEEMLASDNLWSLMQENVMVMPSALITEAALAIQQIQDTIDLGGKIGVLLPAKKAVLAAFGRLMSLQRIQGTQQVIALAQQDLEEAKQEQDAAAQLEQANQQLATVRKEADALRVKLQLLTAAQSEAMLAEIVATGGQEQQQGMLPPGQEPEGGMENVQEGGIEEPEEVPA